MGSGEPTVSKSDFIRQFLSDNPSASVREVQKAWSSISSSPLNPVLYYLIKAKIRNENKASTRRKTRSPKKTARSASRSTTPKQVASRNDLLSALSAIDTFLSHGQRQHEPQPVVTTHQRLTWRVSHYHGLPTIEAFEQTLNANFQWSKGRKVSADRLINEVKRWASDIDRKVISQFKATLYSYRYRGYQHQVDSFVALEHLASHPRVYWSDEPEQRIEILSGKPSIVLKQEVEGHRLEVLLAGVVVPLEKWFKEERGVVAVDRASNRIVICRMDYWTANLLRELAKAPPSIPATAEKEWLSRLAKLESIIPVTFPEALQGQRHQADSRPLLRLTPRPEGLLAESLVRPSTEAEVSPPGRGRRIYTDFHEGQRRELTRNFEEEMDRATELARSLAFDSSWTLDRWRWLIPPGEETFDLLDRLRQIPQEELHVEWPEKSPISVTGRVTASALRVVIEDRRDWFGLKGEVEIEGEKVPLDVLLKAVVTGERYIAIGPHKWASIEKGLRERLMALEGVAHPGRSGLQLDRTALPVIADLQEDAVAVKTSKRWKEFTKRLEDAADLPKDPPVTLQAELRDYQLDGVQWLRKMAAWGVGACLADDMGLGKTVQTLALLIERAETGPALIVAPTSVGFNWLNETQRFAPTLRPILHRDTDRESTMENLESGDLLITTYGLLRNEIDRLAKRSWGTLVLDEAQFIKNSQTKSSQAVRSLEADWRLALTGTPLENHLGELWSIFRAISPGLLGSWDRFSTRYAIPIERNNDHDCRATLSRVIRPFILRRTKAQVLTELPSRSENLRVVELSKAERKLYEAARLRALLQISSSSVEGKDQRFEVLAALTRLRQLACHPGLVDASWKKDSAKLDLFFEVVDEIREGNHRALVFSQFVQHLTLIRKALDAKKIKYQYLDGSTSAAEREKRVKAFQSGEGELFLISLKAGGTGLNLTAADYVIHMDPWWNPAVEDQATDRAHRIGQTRPVTVYRLVTKDTIEEKILELHADKRDLIAGILEGADQAAKLSTDQLIGLIRSGGKDQIEEKAPVKKQRRSKTG